MPFFSFLRRAKAVRRPRYEAWDRTTLSRWLIDHQKHIHFEGMHWMGQRILKNPMDCWIYQEILHEVQPEVIVELGSLYGGLTKYLCNLLDLMGKGEVVSVDIDRKLFNLTHPRLVRFDGDCSSPEIVESVAARCAGKRTLVIHDADHRRDPVLRDLRLYAPLVSVGSYLIVEDGIVDVIDPAVSKHLGWKEAGPLAAVDLFLQENNDFEIDAARERYLMTYNPCGYLKRVR